MSDVAWAAANSHAVDTGHGVALHPRSHPRAGAGTSPGLIDGLTWATLTDGMDAWLGTREPAGIGRCDYDEDRPPIPDASDLDLVGAAGGAWHLRDSPSTLIARTDDEGTHHARFTWYEPGESPLALTPEECDHVLRCAGPVRPTAEFGQSGIVGVPHVGGRAWVHERIGLAVSLANAVWFHLPVTTTDHAQLLHYTAGDQMDAHTDASPMFPTRQVSAVVFLSDPADYDGGTLEFLHDPTPSTIPQERGTVAVFPSTLLHRVTPVTSGERYTLTLFCT